MIVMIHQIKFKYPNHFDVVIGIVRIQYRTILMKLPQTTSISIMFSDKIRMHTFAWGRDPINIEVV